MQENAPDTGSRTCEGGGSMKTKCCPICGNTMTKRRGVGRWSVDDWVCLNCGHKEPAVDVCPGDERCYRGLSNMHKQRG